MVDGVLIGVALAGAENHSLTALVCAADGAGLDVRLRTFEGWADIASIVDDVRRMKPRLVGVSIQTTEAALVSLVLLSALRRSGFAGRLVCGGHFSTLNAADILEAAPAVDAVVRLAGERALVELLRRPLDAEILDVPGVVARDGAGEVVFGAPGEVRSAETVRPRAVTLPRHLGFPTADLVVSRGCVHRCHYCCVASTSELARTEAQRAGLAPRGAGYERASLDAIATEIVQLHDDCGARVFNFMDDNVLPTDPRQVVAWADELRRRLEVAGVGRLAMSMQLRADAVTDASAEALASLGVVRAYVGADGYSDRQLHNLGRRSSAESGAVAMQRLAAQGIYPVCNALLIGPTLRFPDVAAEIEGLATIRGGPVHLLPIDVRAGTRYEQVAAAHGLLEGNFLWRHFRFADPRVRALAEVVTAVPSRLHERSVPIALYDLGYNLGIAQRLVPSVDVSSARAAYFRIADAWNAEQIRFLRAAHDAATRGDPQVAADVVAHTRAASQTLDRVWIAACDAHVEDVARAVSLRRHKTCRPYLRGRRLSELALSMSLAACGRSPSSPYTDTGTTTAASTGDTSGPGEPTGTTGAVDPGECPDPADEARLPPVRIGACAELCSGAFGVFDEGGYLVDVVLDGDDNPVPPEILACILELFDGVCFPSLSGMSYELQGHCWIA